MTFYSSDTSPQTTANWHLYLSTSLSKVPPNNLGELLASCVVPYCTAPSFPSQPITYVYIICLPPSACINFHLYPTFPHSKAEGSIHTTGPWSKLSCKHVSTPKSPSELPRMASDEASPHFMGCPPQIIQRKLCSTGIQKNTHFKGWWWNVQDFTLTGKFKGLKWVFFWGGILLMVFFKKTFWIFLYI